MIIHDIEQGTPEWLQLRNGRITGTSLKRLMGAEKKRLLASVIASQEVGFDLEDSDSYVSFDMQWGTDQEPMARIEYEKLTGIKVKKHGFIQHDTKWPFFGLSPDFHTLDNTGAIEIKCPTTTTHVLNCLNNKLPSDAKNDCRYQVYSYFVVHPELQWLDFISYDPRFTKKPFFKYRVNRIDIAKEIIEIEKALDKFEVDLKNALSDLVF